MPRIGRAFGFTAFVLLLAGLPVAVELIDPIEHVRKAGMMTRASDAVAVTSKVSLSKHLALTLDGGLVSPSKSDTSAGEGTGSFVIDEAVVTLDLSHDGPGAAAGAKDDRSADNAPTLPTVAVIGELRAGSLRLRRGQLNFVSPTGQKLVVSDLDASVSASRGGSYRFAGTGTLKGHRISLEGNWSEPSDGKGPSQMPLRLVLRSAALDATFDGQLKLLPAFPTLVGTADITIKSLSNVASLFGIDGRVGDLIGAVAISGPVDWSAKRMAFPRATVRIDTNQATGAVALRHDGPRPSIDATLAFGELDIATALFPSKARSVADAASAGAGAGTKAHSASDSQLGLLREVDADLRLSAERIRIPAVATGSGAFTVVVHDGRMEASLVGLEMEGGTADGALTLDVRGAKPHAVVKLRARGVDSGRVLAAALNRNPLLGRTDIDFDGSAEGVSLAEAFAKLAGRGEVRLVEPGRLGLDLAALAYAARKAPTVSWPAAGKGGTALDRLNCRFRLLNGAVTLEQLQARSGDAALFGSGKIDVPGRLLDVSIGTGPATRGEAPVTAQSLLSLRGTWEEPAISLVEPAAPAPHSQAGILGE